MNGMHYMGSSDYRKSFKKSSIQIYMVKELRPNLHSIRLGHSVSTNNKENTNTPTVTKKTVVIIQP